ncbi:hypothetical protein ACLBXM_18940 [Xanthobacteraceae bacterium A53D]
MGHATRTPKTKACTAPKAGIDPALALIERYRSAGAAFYKARAEQPEAERKKVFSVYDVYGPDLINDLRSAPVAQSRAGAIAALELAIEEIEHLLGRDTFQGLARSALGFLKMSAPAETRPATRAEMEAYRAWLHMEGRMLGHELYPNEGERAERLVRAGTGVGELHMPRHVPLSDMAPPSSRAVRVLQAVGANFDRIETNAREFESSMAAACNQPSATPS